MGKLVEELKKYFKDASPEQLLQDWDELKEWNEVGDDISDVISENNCDDIVCSKYNDIVSYKFEMPLQSTYTFKDELESPESYRREPYNKAA